MTTPRLDAALRRALAIPVVALDRATDAVPLAETLVGAGITLLEITLRTPAGLDAIRAVRAAGIPIVVAAGTVRTAQDFAAAQEAGAQIVVSPGATQPLIDAARHADVPWLPGAATPSEVMRLVDAGFAIQKLFPARLDVLDALAGPFPDVAWVPTGGVDAHNARGYLARRGVLAIAGSWIAPRAAIAERAWTDIARRATEALTLGAAR